MLKVKNNDYDYVEALQLLNNGGLVRRLKRTKPLELV
jgi:hypothetical protein